MTLNVDELVKKKTIDLPDKRLNDDDLEVIIKLLRDKNAAVKKMYLRGNNITLADGKFTDALAENDTLEELRLYDNAIGEVGAKFLAAALVKNNTLMELDLSNNDIGAEGARHLAEALKVNITLETIWLYGTNIGAEGAKYLATALTNNKTLKELDLSNSNIGEEGVKCLAAALSNNNNLKGLDLSNNNIGAEGAKYLAEALKVNTTLEVIYLDDNKIGDEGAKYLARALMVNITLLTIDLVVNSISDEGAKSIATALLLNEGIQRINLLSNKIGNQGAKKLEGALEHNNRITTLSLRGNQINDSRSEKIEAIVKDTNRKRKKLTSQQLKEIIAMKDEELANNVKAMVKQDTIIAMKDEKIADKDKAIVQQGDKLKASEEEKKRLKQDISSKEREIASLKAAVRGPLKQLKKLELIVNAVDMTSDEAEPNSKRPRTENAPKSMHAIMHEQNQKLVQVKQEKIAAETILENERGEKEAVQRKMELELECKICFELKDETCALVPCGHIMCSGCAGGYTACPTCSRNVESRFRLYK